MLWKLDKNKKYYRTNGGIILRYKEIYKTNKTTTSRLE